MLALEAEGRVAGFELDLRIEVEPGTCVAIAGPSGAGKTTALRIIAGLARPERGRVSCEGEVWLDTTEGTNLAPERRRCGYLFQEYALFPHMRAWQNVAYGLTGTPRAEHRRVAEEHLDRLGVADLADARPARLSGGERQRVALARALASSPRALLLDEPLSALDARTRARASRELAETFGQLGVPTLLVTHDFGEAALLADEVAVIDGGRIVQRGGADELAAAPRSAFVADLTGAVVLTGRAHRRDDGLTAIDLDGGGTVLSTDVGVGDTAISVFPWEIELEPAGREHVGSAQNRIPAEVARVTRIGGRVRVGLAASQAISADVTPAAVRRLGLDPGTPVTAVWKASATRIVSTLAEPG